MTPNRLNVQNGDFIHFQWTGSNTNPRNNAGNGLDGTDRSNMVVQRSANFNDHYATTNPPTKGIWGNSYPSRVDDSIPFLGLSVADQTYLATLQQVAGVLMPGAQFGGNMDQFDDAGTYFDLGARQVTQSGIYHYISTRNNAFSNRSQKGKIVVSNAAAITAAVGVNGGTIQAAGGQSVIVPPAAFSSLSLVTASAVPRESAGTSPLKGQASDFLTVGFPGTASTPITVTLNYDSSPLHVQTIMRASSISAGDWQKADGDLSGGQAKIQTQTPGVYAVDSKLNGGAVAGIVIGCLVFIALVSFIVFKVYRRNKGATLATKNNAHIKAGVPSSPSSSGVAMTPVQV